MENNQSEIVKALPTRLFYLLVLLLLFYRGLQGALLHHVAHSGLFYTGFDKTYWLWVLTGIPAIINHSSLFSWGIDLTLIAFTFICFYKPTQVLFSRLFWMLFLVFYLTFNLYADAFFKPGLAILMVGFTFCFHKTEEKAVWWKFSRYYFLFIYVSSALWKISKGGLQADGWFSTMLTDENIQSFYFQKFFLFKNACWWLIQHPFAADMFYKAGILLELVFLLGFFTEKWDKWLIIVSIVLHLSISLLLDIHIYWLEFQVFYITLHWSGFSKIETKLDRILMTL